MFYVTMTDKFMSGWGHAQNKTNKLIIECNTIDEAEQIERAARRRSEMKYVNICARRPRYGTHVLESWKTYADMTGWRA
jgi:cell division protein FtsL